MYRRVWRWADAERKKRFARLAQLETALEGAIGQLETAMIVNPDTVTRKRLVVWRELLKEAPSA